MRVHPEELKGRVEQESRSTEAAGLGGDRQPLTFRLAPDDAGQHFRPRPDRCKAKGTAYGQCHVAPGGQNHDPIAKVGRAIGNIPAQGRNQLRRIAVRVAGHRGDFDVSVGRIAEEGQLCSGCRVAACDCHQDAASNGHRGGSGRALETREGGGQSSRSGRKDIRSQGAFGCDPVEIFVGSGVSDDEVIRQATDEVDDIADVNSIDE
jgi:hypothetical protein